MTWNDMEWNGTAQHQGWDAGMMPKSTSPPQGLLSSDGDKLMSHLSQLRFWGDTWEEMEGCSVMSCCHLPAHVPLGLALVHGHPGLVYPIPACGFRSLSTKRGGCLGDAPVGAGPGSHPGMATAGDITEPCPGPPLCPCHPAGSLCCRGCVSPFTIPRGPGLVLPPNLSLPWEFPWSHPKRDTPQGPIPSLVPAALWHILVLVVPAYRGFRTAESLQRNRKKSQGLSEPDGFPKPLQ